MSDYPTRCAFCGHLTPSGDALEQHLIDADHASDPTYPVFYARRRLDRARESLELHGLRAREAFEEWCRVSGHVPNVPRLCPICQGLCGGLSQAATDRKFVEHVTRHHSAAVFA